MSLSIHLSIFGRGGRIDRSSKGRRYQTPYYRR